MRKWWEDHPGGNVGLVYGPKWNLNGLDIDGEGGKRLLHEWAAGNPLPHTWRYTTPNGERVLFRCPPGGVRTRQHKGGDQKEALRLQGAGAYTVAPPSRIGEKEYTWITDCRPGEVELAECPQWLLDRFQAPAAQQGNDQVGGRMREDGPSVDGGRPHPIERARKYLARAEPAVSGSGGHGQTFKLACKLVHGFGLSDGEALSLLDEWNRTCRPPWSEQELRHKIEEAREKGSADDLAGAGRPARQGVVTGVSEASAPWQTSSASGTFRPQPSPMPTWSRDCCQRN